MPTLYWLQGAGCGGDTLSLLSSDAPNLYDLCNTLNIDLLWHPSLSNISVQQQTALHELILSGAIALDFLILEGAALLGPSNTCMFDARHSQPEKDLGWMSYPATAAKNFISRSAMWPTAKVPA